MWIPRLDFMFKAVTDDIRRDISKAPLCDDTKKLLLTIFDLAIESGLLAQRKLTHQSFEQVLLLLKQGKLLGLDDQILAKAIQANGRPHAFGWDEEIPILRLLWRLPESQSRLRALVRALFSGGHLESNNGLSRPARRAAELAEHAFLFRNKLKNDQKFLLESRRSRRLFRKLLRIADQRAIACQGILASMADSSDNQQQADQALRRWHGNLKAFTRHLRGNWVSTDPLCSPSFYVGMQWQDLRRAVLVLRHFRQRGVPVNLEILRTLKILGLESRQAWRMLDTFATHGLKPSPGLALRLKRAIVPATR